MVLKECGGWVSFYYNHGYGLLGSFDCGGGFGWVFWFLQEMGSNFPEIWNFVSNHLNN